METKKIVYNYEEDIYGIDRVSIGLVGRSEKESILKFLVNNYGKVMPTNDEEIIKIEMEYYKKNRRRSKKNLLSVIPICFSISLKRRIILQKTYYINMSFTNYYFWKYNLYQLSSYIQIFYYKSYFQDYPKYFEKKVYFHLHDIKHI